jgi:molecular chaperone DnaK
MNLDTLNRELAAELADALSKSLPEIGGDNWWGSYVLNELTPAQRYQVELLENPDLFQLDLAALLRLFNRNWSELALKKHYQKIGINLIRDLISARNRWAHEPASGHDLEDLYRDLDTAKRFLSIISLNKDFIERIDQYRIEILDKLANKKVGPPVNFEPINLHPEIGQIKAIDNTNFNDLSAETLTSELQVKYKSILAKKTYIGIDFGTSTTVASYIKFNDSGSRIIVEPIEVRQIKADGCVTRYHLIPSCIALNPSNGEVIIGIGAKELQYHLKEGIDVWSSFKMQLGVDIGPKYRNTKLRRGNQDVFIENAQDATREFFKFVHSGISDFIKTNNLPEDIALAVTVPASFEANQRRDLMIALESAGFKIDEYCLIDEPNAAFLSVLHNSWIEKTSFAEFLKRESRNILVFDFGAGTCDISILRISVIDGQVKSKNLSISKFFALGGNDIDRAIAEDILLPQLLAESFLDNGITSDQTEDIVIPKLMPIAERLKIQCSKLLMQKGLSDVSDCFTLNESVTDHSIPDLIIGKNILKLNAPTIKLSDFARIMEQFIEVLDVINDFDEQPLRNKSIFSPMYSALDKANLEKDNLDSIIFIGGSSESTIIQAGIRNHFGRFVEALIPRDLRTHVSQGAAFHSFAHHALGTDVIQPITSEPIMLVTANGGLEEILSAGSDVPTKAPHLSRFIVPRNGQSALDLPICVSSEDKILQVLNIHPFEGKGFHRGQELILQTRMTSDKILEVVVMIDGIETRCEQLNPLSNTPLTAEEFEFLIAKQVFNQAVFDGKGRPSLPAVIAYGDALSIAKKYLKAAEIYEQVEHMDSSRDLSILICYNYDFAGKKSLAEKWSEISFKRNANPVSAYNVAIFKYRSGNNEEAKDYLEKSLELNSSYSASLYLMGKVLDELGQTDTSFYQKAIILLKRALKNHNIDLSDCNRLINAAIAIGDTETSEEAKLFREKLNRRNVVYNRENLVESENNNDKTNME